MADDEKHITEAESLSFGRKYQAVFAFFVIAAIGVLMILYAWRLPPFSNAIQTTENALVRGQVTIISPQVNGYVTSVKVQDFQSVKKGDILVQIDDRIYRQKVEQAKAQLTAQQAALKNNVQQQLISAAG